MSTPEGRVKKGVRDLLSGYQGMYVYMPVPTGYGRTSLDFIGCFRGRFFAVETKVAGKKLTPRQERTVAEMRASGAEVFVVTGEGRIPLAPLKQWLDELDAHTDTPPQTCHRSPL